MKRAYFSFLMLLAAATSGMPALAHDSGAFSAGAPGDPKKPNRLVQVVMRETEDGKMVYAPARIDVRLGEQIRFQLRNVGDTDHEFILATPEENEKHAEEMKKNPDMEHDEPNGKRLAPKKSAELLWRFTKRGEFEFGCMIPGHREAGMVGKVIVK